MKKYPTIPGPDGKIGLPCVSFIKFDGSNIRFEYSRKKGWHQQGTRYQSFSSDDPTFGCAIDIFHDTLAPTLNKILKEYYPKATEAIAFCEFFGPNSFAGQHDLPTLRKMGMDVQTNNPKRLVLIDFNVHKQGLVMPEVFCDRFVKNLPKNYVAEPIYKGTLDQTFVNLVMESKTPGDEGVVCKGGSSVHDRWMCKIKTKVYLGMLKTFLPNTWKEFWDWENS